MVLSQHNSAYKNLKRLLMKYYQFLRNVSVGRALYCRTGGRGFDSRGRTKTQGLKITGKWRYLTFAWLGWSREMAVPSPLGDVKYSVHNYHFRAKYIDTQINCIFFGGGGRGVVVTKRPGVQKVPSSIVGRTWVFSIFSFFFFTFSLLFSYIVLFVD